MQKNKQNLVTFPPTITRLASAGDMELEIALLDVPSKYPIVVTLSLGVKAQRC
jgi:hypothetical protein